MTEPKEDEDMKSAVNELGTALDEVLLGATSDEVLRIINAVDALIEVRLAQFAEMLADRLDAAR